MAKSFSVQLILLNFLPKTVDDISIDIERRAVSMIAKHMVAAAV